MLDETLIELSQVFLQSKSQQYQRYFMGKQFALTERFSILLGQRGVGKTTLLIQHLLNYVALDALNQKILYIPVDHFLVTKHSLYEIAKNFQMMGGEFIAFDEIHKYNNWSLELKSIYDTYPNLKMIASGSAALKIHRGSHDLSRRAIIYNIPGLSFREYLELKLTLQLPSYNLPTLLSDHQKIANMITQKLQNEKIIPLFHSYLEYGYYPYFYDLNDVSKFKLTLEQNVHVSLESDLPAVYPKLTNISINKIKKLLVFIANNVPYTPNWNTLKNFLEIGDERTLKTYLCYLEDAGLITLLYKASKQLDKLESPKKLYLQNSNLMYTITDLTANKGTVREMFFYNQLKMAHQLTLPMDGDFLVDDQFVFEVGGNKKSFAQLKNRQQAYVASDNIEIGINNKIPLWLFGFLY